MNQTKFAEVQATKRSWPTPQDYNEALQHPGTNFCDSELMTGKSGLNRLGLPNAMTGNFASVYFMDCPKRDYAVRCFLHDIADQKERYDKISTYLNEVALPFMADFDYFDKGVMVSGNWFPIVRMDWVDGQSLIQFIGRNLDNASVLNQLRSWIRDTRRTLKDKGIAHCDLQHGNILVTNEGVKLVDYDGMYVPSLNGHKSNELGHRNYQHPARSNDHFGPYLDNFSYWLIDTSLFCLEIDPTLWFDFNCGDDCLLFREKDLKDPLSSPVFRKLENHKDAEIRQRVKCLRSLLLLPIENIPDVDGCIEVPSNLPELNAVALKPDWLSSAEYLTKSPLERTEAKTLTPTEDFSPTYLVAVCLVIWGLSICMNMPVWLVPAIAIYPTWRYHRKVRKSKSGAGVLNDVVMLICVFSIPVLICAFMAILANSDNTEREQPSRSVANTEDTATTQFNEGMQYYSQEDFRAALPYFDRAIHSNSSRPGYFKIRGICYAKLGDHDKAIEDFKQVTRLIPTATNYFNLGHEYEANGELNEAIEMYQKTLQLDPNHSIARNNLLALQNRLKQSGN